MTEIMSNVLTCLIKQPNSIGMNNLQAADLTVCFNNS